MRKGFLACLTAIAISLLLTVAISANATDNAAISDEEKYQYTINTETNTVTITGSKTYVVNEDPIYGNTVAYCVSGDVTIPSELEGYPVTELADYAFNGCSIDMLVIPEGIKKVGYICGNPEEVTIPASVTHIDNGAFCCSLEHLVINPDNPVYSVSDNCLIETSTKTLINASKSGVIPSDGSVVSIGSSAFCHAKLENLVIPDAVTHIDGHAFIFADIDNIFIGSGFTETGNLSSQFYQCTIKESIVVSEDNPVYHSRENCLIETKTKTLHKTCNNSSIPNDGSIEIINTYAFAELTHLKRVIIPDGVTAVREYAFQGCSNLEYIEFPESVEYIGGGAFEYCSNLAEIVVDRANLVYHSIDNCLINTAQRYLVQGCKNSIIPADGSVETIGYAAFYGLSNMHYLNIPEGVKTIGDSAFCGTSLFMVSLPSTLQTIECENFNNSTLKYILYNGSEEDQTDIEIKESWPGQNSGLNSAQWYYNGERPFPEITVSAEPVECTKLIDGSKWYTIAPGDTIDLDTHSWFEYDIDPQITVTYADGTVFTGNTEEVEAKLGFPVEIYHNQTNVNQWDIGTYTARIYCLDQTTEVKVTIVDHPIEKIEIQDVTVVENTSGYESNNGYTYSFSPQYTVTFKDGSVLQVDYSLFDKYIEVAGKSIRIDTNIYSMQQQDPWVAGQSYEVKGALLDVTDTFTVTIKEKSLTNIAITSRPEKLVYTVGEELDIGGLIVTAYYDNNTIARVTDYEVTGYDISTPGQQTITVSYGGKQAIFQVNVLPIRVTGITVTPTEVPIITQNTTTLSATVSPADATNKKVTWSSSNPQVATVDDSGVVTALKAGNTTITATTQDGQFTDTCKIFVVCNHATLVYQERVDPDCMKEGTLAHYACSGCDNLYKEDKSAQTTKTELAVKALGHSFTNYVSDNNATYDADSTKTAKCERDGCNATDTVTDEGTRLLRYGWHAEGSKWYYYVDGVMQTGWVQDQGAWYYLRADGAMATGWVQDGGKWYFLESSGVMVASQWRKDSKGWCWLTASGAMATNAWVKDSKGWCYVGADGYCLTNCWAKDSIGWIWLDREGSMTKNQWIQVGGKWYYLNSSGYMSTGWLQSGSTWYYLKPSGEMAIGWLQSGSTWYYLKPSGEMATGWLQVGGTWYYFHGSGAMATGSVKIGNKTYNFNASGACLNP